MNPAYTVCKPPPSGACSMEGFRQGDERVLCYLGWYVSKCRFYIYGSRQRTIPVENLFRIFARHILSLEVSTSTHAGASSVPSAGKVHPCGKIVQYRLLCFYGLLYRSYPRHSFLSLFVRPQTPVVSRNQSTKRVVACCVYLNLLYLRL